MNTINVKLIIHRLRIALIALPLLATTACTHMQTVNVQPSPLPARTEEQKVPARAVLVLDDALSRHKLEMKLEGESWILILGQALTQYTRQVTENTFRQVTVFPSMDDTANQADVILHPVLGRTEVNLLSSVWEYKQNILLVVEWNLLDHTGKDTLWLRSVAANSNIEGGSLLFQKKRVQIAFQKLFDDLARKTQKAFDESPEIQRLGE